MCTLNTGWFITWWLPLMINDTKHIKLVIVIHIRPHNSGRSRRGALGKKKKNGRRKKSRQGKQNAIIKPSPPHLRWRSGCTTTMYFSSSLMTFFFGKEDNLTPLIKFKLFFEHCIWQIRNRSCPFFLAIIKRDSSGSY